MHVKPVEGRLVRDPLTNEVLPAEGREVTDSTFWRRRLIKGDMVLVDAKPHAADKRAVRKPEVPSQE